MPGESPSNLLNMNPHRIYRTLAAALLSLLLAGAGAVSAQKKQKNQQQPATGGISGRVRVDPGQSAAGVSVVIRQGDAEVAHATTGAKGDFEVQGLAPGTYGMTLRKPGLQIGRAEKLEVSAGKTRRLGNLYLGVDEGSIAQLRGSVFRADGRSLGYATVEIGRVEADGSVRKLDSHVANGYGQFAFRLPPERARYRVTAKADGMEAASEEVEIDGAAIFRVALSLKPASK